MRNVVFGIALAAVAVAGSPLRAAEAPALVIEPWNVGPVHGHTVFSQAALRAALPGYAVTVETLEGEGGAYQAGMVRQGKTLVMAIYGTLDPRPDGKRYVYAISIHSPLVLNNLGPVVGTPWPKAKEDMAVKDCFLGEEEYSGAVLCPSAQVINLTYVLRGKDESTDGTLPPPAALRRYKVVEIQWSSTEQQ